MTLIGLDSRRPDPFGLRANVDAFLDQLGPKKVDLAGESGEHAEDDGSEPVDTLAEVRDSRKLIELRLKLGLDLPVKLHRGPPRLEVRLTVGRG